MGLSCKEVIILNKTIEIIGIAKMVKIATVRGAPIAKHTNAPRIAPPGEIRHASKNDII